MNIKLIQGLLFAIFFLLNSVEIYSIENSPYTIDEKTGIAKINLSDAVKSVIKNNLTVKNAILEILKTDSPILKNTSKFNWKLVGDITSVKISNPDNNNNFFIGTKLTQDKIAAGIEKQFETGTYFYSEVSTLRFDSNAFEQGNDGFRNLTNSASGFSRLGIPPLYTNALTFKITQELWKYSFGKTEKNTQKILQNNAVLDKERTVFLLTNIVAKVLIDYWTLSILDSAVKTFEELSKNAKNIRDITKQKRGIGIAEAFEVNQWNSIVANIESQLEKAKLERDTAKRNLKRILGIDSKLEVQGVTELVETIPEGINYEKDLEYALNKRIDVKNYIRQRENARLKLDNAQEEDAPSIKVSASWSSRSQNFISPQYGFTNGTNGVPTNKFPEIIGDFTVSYPLWDKGVKAGIDEAKINVAQLNEEEKALRNEIAVELKNRIDAIESSYRTLDISKKTNEETRKFYNGLYEKFRVGRFNATQVKNALDALTQSELGLIQTRVNFNINLIRYDLVKNSIFEKYGIDTDKELEEIVKRAKEESKN
ncbi:MAG: TolC family protein [Leptospiraceae bacterium]|nr:TolC family protein [Leptospiraceae bacterium]